MNDAPLEIEEIKVTDLEVFANPASLSSLSITVVVQCGCADSASWDSS